MSEPWVDVPPDGVTPIENLGDVWAKRDDLCVFGGGRGGKVRSCYHLSNGATGLVTAGSRSSPQVNIVARVGRELGIPTIAHIPAGPTTPEIANAEELGMTIERHRPGYNVVIVARARADAAARGYKEIPFGMECHQAIDSTADQVVRSPFPSGVARIVLAIGSGMTAAAILHGLDRAARADIPIVGIRAGGDPSGRLDRYGPPDWRNRLTVVDSGTPYDRPVEGVAWRGIPLDPYYEAKVIPHIEAGDLFWITGIRSSVDWSRDRFAAGQQSRPVSPLT